MSRLLVSIVTHNSSLDVLRQTIEFLRSAFVKLKKEALITEGVLVLVDNASDSLYLMRLKSFISSYQHHDQLPVSFIEQPENQGYGQGHNVAGNGNEDFRLILNPDVFLAPDALVHALTFMKEDPQVGVVVPRVLDREGKQDYLCKRYPSVLDLALRGFAPAWLRKMFKKHLDYYEMRDRDWTKPHCQVELASGCCLLMRGAVWRALGGFSPDYFMYFEDFDLSMRASKLAPIAYVPGFEVTHLGGNAARKGWRHIVWFVRSAWVFFNRYGWRLW